MISHSLLRAVARRPALAALPVFALFAGAGAPAPAASSQPLTVIAVDAAARRHPISPLIYGVCFGSRVQMQALNFTLNRQGGNNFTRYNWRANTVNIDADYFYESIPGFFLHQPTSFVPGQRADSFIADTKAAGAQPMITVPMLGWVAKVIARTGRLYSFSVAKYGPQQKADPETPDAGNGIKPDGKTAVTGNDPRDASIPAGVDFQRPWVRHVVAEWGRARRGGVRYYILDNEPGLWHRTHQDVHPQGVGSDEYLRDFLSYATMVKSTDPQAQIVGPEEWGWPGFTQSGADQQYTAAHGDQGHPDKDAHGGMDYMPWLLTQIRRHDAGTHRRLLDVFTFHIYPQGGEFSDDVSPKITALRARSTRSLWDPNYKDESWINNTVMLIPRLRTLVDTYYPGTKIGITEYNWGAEKSMSGATAQADILGIFGREGVDLATRWTSPEMDTPTFKAMQMYRNYDGKRSAFGDVSVSDAVPNPDALSSFAAIRRSDGALTVTVINKSEDGPSPVSLTLSHFAGAPRAQVWRLAAGGGIMHLPDTAAAGRIRMTLPAQSVTLLVLPAAPR